MERFTAIFIFAALLGFCAGCTAKSDSPSAPVTVSQPVTVLVTATRTPTHPAGSPTVTPTATTAYPYPYSAAIGQSGSDGVNGDLSQPAGIAITKDGVLKVVSDVGSGNIQVFNSNNVFLYEIDSSNDGATITAPNQPWGMAFDGGRNLYVADYNNAEVDVYTVSAAGATWIGYYVGGGAIAGPQDVKFDNNGNLVVADTASGHTYNIEVSNDGSDDAVLNTTQGDGGGLAPQGVAVDSLGDLYVSDQNNGYVFVYGPDYQFRYAFNGTFGWPTVLGTPAGLQVDNEGKLIIADYGNHQVVRANLYGAFDEVVGQDQINTPDYLALDAVGNLYVTDFGLGQLLKFTPQ